ncbi:hypothetical protein D9M70_600130 [compost metagenome]
MDPRPFGNAIEAWGGTGRPIGGGSADAADRVSPSRVGVGPKVCGGGQVAPKGGHSFAVSEQEFLIGSIVDAQISIVAGEGNG